MSTATNTTLNTASCVAKTKPVGKGLSIINQRHVYIPKYWRLTLSSETCRDKAVTTEDFGFDETEGTM